jgi:hypothetical protein
MRVSTLLNGQRHHRSRGLSPERAKCLDLQIKVVSLLEAIDHHRISKDPFRDLSLYETARQIGK